jgi:hypothetical protein
MFTTIGQNKVSLETNHYRLVTSSKGACSNNNQQKYGIRCVIDRKRSFCSQFSPLRPHSSLPGTPTFGCPSDSRSTENKNSAHGLLSVMLLGYDE